MYFISFAAMPADSTKLRKGQGRCTTVKGIEGRDI